MAVKLLAVDFNKDGEVNVDGLKAVLLIQEFGFKVEEIVEVFNILQKGNGYFHYRDFLCEYNPNLRSMFLQRSVTPSLLARSDTTPGTTSREQIVTQSQRVMVDTQQSSSQYLTSSMQVFEDPKISK